MSPGRVQFGAFEFDAKARILSRNGLDMRVPAQSLAIPEMLIERAGEVVLREEIISRLWPNGTIVEFEHSVNSAVKRLRDALRDTAAASKFIETLAKRGYPFVAALRGGTQGTPRYRILGESGPKQGSKGRNRTRTGVSLSSAADRDHSRNPRGGSALIWKLDGPAPSRAAPNVYSPGTSTILRSTMATRRRADWAMMHGSTRQHCRND